MIPTLAIDPAHIELRKRHCSACTRVFTVVEVIEPEKIDALIAAFRIAPEKEITFCPFCCKPLKDLMSAPDMKGFDGTARRALHQNGIGTRKIPRAIAAATVFLSPVPPPTEEKTSKKRKGQKSQKATQKRGRERPPIAPPKLKLPKSRLGLPYGNRGKLLAGGRYEWTRNDSKTVIISPGETISAENFITKYLGWGFRNLVAQARQLHELHFDEVLTPAGRTIYTTTGDVLIAWLQKIDKIGAEND